MLRQLTRANLRKLAAPALSRNVTPLSSASVPLRSFSEKKKSWVPTQDDLLQKVTVQSLIHEISLQQMESAATVVPWFLKNMPSAYFVQIPEVLRKQHLKAVQAIRDLKQSDLSLKIETKGDQGQTEVTFITSQRAKGLLTSQISTLKGIKDSSLTRVKVFTSLDGELTLNTFFYEKSDRVFQSATEADAAQIFAFAEEVKAGKHAADPLVPTYDANSFSRESILEYLQHVSPAHVKTSDARRFFIQKKLFDKVRGTESTAVYMEDYTGPEITNVGASHSWITIAAANVLPEVLVRTSSAFITARGMDIIRANFDLVSDPANAITNVSQTGTVSMLRLLVTPNPAHHSTSTIPQADFQAQLHRELERAKWLDDEVTDLALVRQPFLGVDKAEVITAICTLLHGPLSKQNSSVYSSSRTILRILDGSPHFIKLADEIAALFLDRFRPTTQDSAGRWHGLGDAEFNARASAIQAKISVLHFEAARVLLLKMLETTRLTLRTNFFNKGRFALSLRVDPTLLVPVESGKPVPFGVFFMSGRNFNAFHCRFRDIARGGLRIVTPPNADQYVLESSRQFDEAYGLSYAQQLKNKDIPEGGSKGVVLVNSPSISPEHKDFAMRKAVKAFTDSLLDLIVKDSVSGLVDLYGKDELIYLGPDEQVTPWDIDWIVERAAQRGYPIPAACMSSKQGAGINHKQYGVTSEGVVVYLDVALRNVLNIDPHKQSFTIKVTGGPDGDVAGNLLKIMFREYGDNCKVVGIADGFGVAEDPHGLNSAELLRLVEGSLPITSFSKSLLSSEGILLDNTTNEGLARRNSMPFRVKSDAFVPAGGRPNTINGDNWRQFLDENGKPSSPLIVEGANIFNTPEARANLFKHAGVVIVKDSSANKCGVVTSSCEVAASMLLSKQEFLDVKKELVEDVIVRLKIIAKLEADLLFRAYKNFPGDLPHFSERISNAINKVTDAITDALADVNPEDALFQELMPLIQGKFALFLLCVLLISIVLITYLFICRELAR